MSTLPRSALPLALSAWSYLCGADEDRAASVPRALGWLRACWEAGHDHLPYLLVHDLGHLLLHGRDFRFSSGRALERWPEEERALRLAYEDKVLGRWALDPSVKEAHVSVAGLAGPVRELAIAHAVALGVARPLLGAELSRGNPAHLRELTPSLVQALQQVPDAPEEHRASLDAEWLAWASGQLQALMAALPPGRLLSDEDLWEIAHLEELTSESARLSLRLLHEMTRQWGALPPIDQSRVRHRIQQVPIDQTDADHYPTGGFDAVSTRGSYENLVRSEIVYVGEGRLDDRGDSSSPSIDVAGCSLATTTPRLMSSRAEGRAGQTGRGSSSLSIDLFDVRYLEGELLYYTRDESPLLDAQRTLQIVVDRPAQLRFKHAALPAQTLVMVQALALVLQQDLVRTFGPAAARAHLAWRVETPQDAQVAEEEQALLSVTLRSELAHHRATLSQVSDLGEIKSKTPLVLSPLAQPGRFRGTWIRVDGERWLLGDRPVDARSFVALRELATELLFSCTF